MSYFNNGSGIEVLEENNYYPFGLKHEGYNVLAGNSAYHYKYQGQELQNETGWYSFKWRNYMPDLGRFFNIDILAEDYNYQTPYAFSENKVTNHVELEGLEAIPIGPGAVPIAPPPPAYGSTTTGLHPVGRIIPTWFSRGIENLKDRVSTPSKLTVSLFSTASSAAINIYNNVMKSEGDDKIDKSKEGNDEKSATKTEDGKRRKNRLPDKGEPNTVETNESQTTSKKYGPDGNVQKEYNKGHGPKYPKNEQDDHIHDYKPNPNNPSGRGDRQPGRPPKKGELLKDFKIRR
ncbi:RHS repeat-associated core domain-containing protein [Chryseobacterium taeanense]|uniref:RHS repeat-associated core domain-containing protein n=1 Tax=Chryseobacterium taeanense TaxID=311334 RepID=A0A1G8LZQ0_9FLAO|nr:RHS repeat-associated core domain-containing protein [Chryseobacterium taeanense]SDI61159.1 RHS repeat-associated core domain-containing protein [Chryseobacterium taeanense]